MNNLHHRRNRALAAINIPSCCLTGCVAPNAATLTKAATLRDGWMEFGYKISELRAGYLRDKHFKQTL